MQLIVSSSDYRFSSISHFTFAVNNTLDMLPSVIICLP